MPDSSPAESYDDLVIDVSQLVEHQQRLGGLIDRVATAEEASRVPIDPGAFGAFGHFMGIECAGSQREGAVALGVALEEARSHYQKVGAWASDLDEHELNVIEMFNTIEVGDES
jgi:hypothetical protein